MLLNQAFKQEKDQKGFGRRPDAPFPIKSSGTSLVRKPSLGQDSNHLSRQGSVASASFQAIVPTRLRSLSTTGSPWGKLTRTPSVKTASKASLSSSVSTLPSADMPTGSRIAVNKNGFPQRTRTKAHNRESMDLDDIMNQSDEDLNVDFMSPTRSPKRPTTPKRSSHAPQKVSQNTRDLIEFLAVGPPEAPTLSRSGRDLVDFLSEGPPDYASSTISFEKSRGNGNRLQKMMSKLNIGHHEKSKGSPDGPRTPQHPRSDSKSPNGTLSSLANKPIPPRPPRAPNAPSAFPVCDIPDENKAIPQKTAHPDAPSHDSSAVERLVQEPPKTITNVPPITHPLSSSSIQPQTAEKPSISGRSPPSAFVHTNGINIGSASHATPPPRSSSQHALRSPVKAAVPPTTTVVKVAPTITESDVRDMHRLLTNATTADECRLIFGMFMARNGMPLELKKDVSSQAPRLRTTHTTSETCLESSLVELLLGNSTSFDFVAS